MNIRAFPVRRALALAALGLLATACRIDATVGVTVNDDGSGLVSVRALFDDEALARAGGLRFDDLRAAGWTVEAPTKLAATAEAPAGNLVTASKPFSGSEQFSAVMQEIMGPQGYFRDFQLQRRSSFAKTSFVLSGSIDATAGLAAFSDPAVAALLGGAAFGRPDASVAAAAASSTLTLAVALPGGAQGASDSKRDGLVLFNIEPGEPARPVLLTSTKAANDARLTAAFAVALAVAALVALVAAAFGRREGRGREGQRRDGGGSGGAARARTGTLLRPSLLPACPARSHRPPLANARCFAACAARRAG